MTGPARRDVLMGGVALLAASRVWAAPKGPPARLQETPASGAILRANAHPVKLGPQGRSTPAWIYGDHPFPVLRARADGQVNATLENALMEHTSIHWHGVRLPNAMDGVPYVTQAPVQPGKRFDYAFVAPDPGTYFFHPHCDTSAQLGRGLAGVLIVDGDEAAPFDDDIICVIKDWRVGPDGGFLPFLTPSGAARAGTFGTLRTVNAMPAPIFQIPAGGDIRLRLINVDSTRIAEIGVGKVDAFVIAIDGHAVTPFTLDTWRLGPAMRIDLALRAPEAGKQFHLFDYFAAQPVRLASFAPVGVARNRSAFAPNKLKPVQLPEPDLARAETRKLALGATATAANYVNPPDIVLPNGTRIALADSLCLAQRTFWSIDGQSWPEHGHQHLPPPLMSFRRGQHVAIEFFNATPHAHPMHLHGHVFKVLAADKYKRPVHWADTVLVMPDERVQIAFVAGNPGNWMIHCHIVEHQDTGMMAWFRVA